MTTNHALVDTRFDENASRLDTDTMHYFGTKKLPYRVDLSAGRLEYLACASNQMWKRIDVPVAVVEEMIRLNNHLRGLAIGTARE